VSSPLNWSLPARSTGRLYNKTRMVPYNQLELQHPSSMLFITILIRLCLCHRFLVNGVRSLVSSVGEAKQYKYCLRPTSFTQTHTLSIYCASRITASHCTSLNFTGFPSQQHPTSILIAYPTLSYHHDYLSAEHSPIPSAHHVAQP
jgi:hypothetical protein